MEISYHSQRRTRADRELAQNILALARVMHDTTPAAVRPFMAPRTQAQQFEFKTKMEALGNGWPQDRHFEIERKRRIPIVGGFIADKLHNRMVGGVYRRRTEAQSARF